MNKNLCYVVTVTFYNTFKYHVSCRDGKISVTISLLFYLFFRPSSHPTVVFLSCRPFVVNTTFSTPTVNCPSLETEETSTPTRPVENVVLTTKGLQEINT